LVNLGVATATIPTGVLFAGVNLLFPVPFLLGIVVVCIGLSGRAGPRATNLVVILAACACIGPFALTAYLNRAGPPIDFVVPVGFQGTVEIVRDRSRGEDLMYEHGQYVITVPASGVVRLKVDPPVNHWHQEFCHDTEGRVRRLEGKGTTIGADRLGEGDDGVVYSWEVH
jgi:hypothetical protein